MSGAKPVAGTAALVKGISVMRAIANEGSAPSFTRLQAVTQLPKGTLHRFLKALIVEGLVRYQSHDRSYHLGLHLLGLASQVLEELDIRDVAREELVRLRDITGEAVHLAIHDDLKAVYIDVVESGLAVDPIARIGSSSALHNSAVGKAIAAFLPPEQLSDAIRRLAMTRTTANTIASRRALKDHLESVRSQGYAFNEEEESVGIHGVAAPVYNHLGLAVGSVCTTIPSYRYDPSKLAFYAAAVVETASAISRRMGYRETDVSDHGSP